MTDPKETAKHLQNAVNSGWAYMAFWTDGRIRNAFAEAAVLLADYPISSEPAATDEMVERAIEAYMATPGVGNAHLVKRPFDIQMRAALEAALQVKP